MPTNTNQAYKEMMKNPAIAQAMQKAQEDSQKISQIYDTLITPGIQEAQEQQYISRIVDEIKGDLGKALDQIGPEARDGLIAYFVGQENLPKSIISALESGQAREELRARYNDWLWTNAVRKLDYSTAEEKTKEYLLEVKAERMAELYNEKDKDKIKYLLGEINNSPEKNEIYKQIANILKNLGYKPKSLEEKISEEKPQNQSQQKTPEDSRTQDGGLEQATSEEQKQENKEDHAKKEKSPKEKFGNIENANDYLRYITGLNKEKDGDNQEKPNYTAQLKQQKENYKQLLKEQDEAKRQELEARRKANKQEELNQETEVETGQEESGPEKSPEIAQETPEEPTNNEPQEPDFISGLNQATQNIRDAFEQGTNNMNKQYQQTTQREREERRRENTKFSQEFANAFSSGIKDSFQSIFENLNNFNENTSRNTNDSSGSENQSRYDESDIVDAEFEIVGDEPETPEENKIKLIPYIEENQPTQEQNESIRDAILDTFKDFKPYISNNPDAGTIITRENSNNYIIDNKNSKNPGKAPMPDRIIESEINSPRRRKYFLKQSVQNEPKPHQTEKERARVLRSTRQSTGLYTEQELDDLAEMDNFVQSGQGTYQDFWKMKNER